MKRHITKFLIAFSLIFGTAVMPVDAAQNVSMREFFSPSEKVLVGFNYVTNKPAVLWFEDFGNSKFGMYNSTKPERCHRDDFTWTKTRLLYESTFDGCGSIARAIVYTPGITFFPSNWNGRKWSVSGRSVASSYEDGKLVCTGVNVWKSQIIGYIGNDIHWRTSQVTTWKSGPCAPWVTRWQEDYVLGTFPDGSKGLLRSFGGNLDGGFNWDVWMSGWK